MTEKNRQKPDAEARSQEIALFRYGLISSLLFDAPGCLACLLALLI